MESLLKKRFLYDLEPWSDALATLVARKREAFDQASSPTVAFSEALRQLPDIRPAHVDLAGDRVVIGRSADLDNLQRQVVEENLRRLGPWRKGPFDLFGIRIDSEWASDLKWNRIKDRLPPLAGRRILDIGSSNGYYLFRMAAARPEIALGIEPHPAYYFQYLALQHYARVAGVHCLPVPFEELPDMKGYFDAVFCMGILYHRRSPVDFLRRIASMLSPGGLLVVETLIIEADTEIALFPRDRYAKMNNVFFIPSIACLTNWLTRAGFGAVRIVDVTTTTGREQRETDWIDTESLVDFLDVRDPRKTVEGYPAPVRAMVTAQVYPAVG